MLLVTTARHEMLIRTSRDINSQRKVNLGTMLQLPYIVDEVHLLIHCLLNRCLSFQ